MIIITRNASKHFNIFLDHNDWSLLSDEYGFICGEYPRDDTCLEGINNSLVTLVRLPFLKQYAIYYV